MPKLSPQTKSFIVLIIIALVGSYVCLWLWGQYNLKNRPSAGDKVIIYDNEAQENNNQEQTPAVDTSTWPTYSDKKYNLSFKHKPDWKVLPITQEKGFDVIQVDPGKKFYNIKIYVSPKEFFAMDSLPTTGEVIAGQPALNVKDLLFGIKNGSDYFTFDIGLSLSLKPDFAAMVRSVQFY